MSPRGEDLNRRMRSDTMAKIVKAALEVFAEYGYHGSTMNKIMQVSKLSKGLLYHYFPSKEKMFIHLVEIALRKSRDIWAEALDPPGTAWEKILRLSEDLSRLAFTDENSLYFLVMVQALTQGRNIPGLFPFIMERSSHYDRLPALIAEAQKNGQAVAGDPELLAAAYFALFQGFTLISHIDKEMKNKITAGTFIGILRNAAENPNDHIAERKKK